MNTKQKAKQLALTLVGEDQNPEPLIEVLVDMAKWQEEKDKEILKEEGLMIVPDEQFETMKRSLIKLSEEKEQMMKNAIDGRINAKEDDITLCQSLPALIRDNGWHKSDKVKVIIIK